MSSHLSFPSLLPLLNPTPFHFASIYLEGPEQISYEKTLEWMMKIKEINEMHCKREC